MGVKRVAKCVGCETRRYVNDNKLCKRCNNELPTKTNE